MAVDIPTAVYGALVAAGGIMGYVKAGSVMSLGMGVTSGVLLCFGAYQMGQDPKNFYLSLGVSCALLGLMGHRFYNSGKFMPAGLVAGMSLLSAARLGSRLVLKGD